MICPNENCGKNVSPYDEKCPYCGTNLPEHPVKDYIRAAGKSGKIPSKKVDNSVGEIKSAPEKLPERDSQETETEEESEISDDVRKLIMEQAGRADEIKSMIFDNPYIQKNAEYRSKVEKTVFWFDWENQQVNASACALDKQAVEKSGGAYWYMVRVHGGFVNFAYANAAACRKKAAGGIFYHMETLKQVMQVLKENSGSFGIPEILCFFPEHDNLSKYGMAAFKVVYHCIAHELGHICYGHVYGPGYDHKATAANIGQEYDADSFAYSLIAESSFKEELWSGMIRFMIAQAAIQFVSEQYDTKTHPLYIDRLKTAISRFPDLAEDYQIDGKWAEEIVWKLQHWLSP